MYDMWSINKFLATRTFQQLKPICILVRWRSMLRRKFEIPLLKLYGNSETSFKIQSSHWATMIFHQHFQPVTFQICKNEMKTTWNAIRNREFLKYMFCQNGQFPKESWSLQLHWNVRVRFFIDGIFERKLNKWPHPKFWFWEKVFVFLLWAIW